MLVLRRESVTKLITTNKRDLPRKLSYLKLEGYLFGIDIDFK